MSLWAPSASRVHLRSFRNTTDANLRVFEAIRDHARTRPSGDSFVAEFIVIAFEILGASLEVGADTTKTPEERERLIEEFAEEKLGELLGPDYVTATLALEEAREGLSEETLALLDSSGCEIFGEETEAGGSFEEPETSLGTFGVGESVHVGDYLVQLTNAYMEDEGTVSLEVTIQNAEGSPVTRPDWDTQMSLQDQDGYRYDRTSAYRNGVDYSLTYVDVPEDAVGLTWKFSDGATGAAFDLTGIGPLQASIETDREALVALYNAADGPNWSSNTNWLSEEPIGEWAFVYTDDSGRVLWLYLDGNQLSGEIPAESGQPRQPENTCTSMGTS